MKVTAYKTPIIRANQSLTDIIAQTIPSLPERSVLVIASKAFSTCEGRFVAKNNDPEQKTKLVQQEAELYTDPHSSKYHLMLTVKRGLIFVNAGIDESNADGQYLLWPIDPQASINKIWQFLRQHYQLKEVGVTMSDSASNMLSWGVVGRAIAYCGFNPLRSYIGKPDIFGRLLTMEQTNVMHSLTDAAVLEMGEGNEQQPLAVVSEISNIEFLDHEPTTEELAQLQIELEDDAFAPLLTKAEWKKS